MRVVLLDHLPVHVFPFDYFAIYVNKMTAEELKMAVDQLSKNWPLISHIKNPDVAKVASEILGVEVKATKEPYRPNRGDIVYLLIPEEENVKPEKIKIYAIVVLTLRKHAKN